jgi:8-oxo-dGTP pyrophosphatase MutT (NUDIX family)
MQLNHDTVTSAPKDASTLVLLRSRAAQMNGRDVGLPQGLSSAHDANASGEGKPAQLETEFEVLLLKRHSQSNVLGGAHVFAGGKCEEADVLWAQDHLDAKTLHHMHISLGEPDITHAHAGGLFVAAVREAHEECGVLLASASPGSESSVSLQERVNSRLLGASLIGPAFAELGIEFDWHLIRPWSRWITPKTPTVMNKRFDARFFVAQMPPAQTAVHDDHETTQSDWFTPQEALSAYARREIDLAAPQIMTLLELAEFASLAEVMDQASKRLPPLIEPNSVREDDKRMVCFPGDTLHHESQRILPGPTRLYFKEGCFQPDEGLDYFKSLMSEKRRA